MNQHLRFHDFATEPKTLGMKLVIFRIDMPGYEPMVDYGFCDFGIDGWAEMEHTKVIKWTELAPLEQPKSGLIFAV